MKNTIAKNGEKIFERGEAGFTIIIKNLTEDFSKKKKKKCELLAYVLKPLHCKGKWVSPFPTLD